MQGNRYACERNKAVSILRTFQTLAKIPFSQLSSVDPSDKEPF